MAMAASGIRGFHDVRFWLALTMYAAAVPLLFEDGRSWASFQVVMPTLIAFIVVSTVAWDYRVIGNPQNPFCLVLHVAFFVAMVVLLNRLMLTGDVPRPLVAVPTVTGFAVDFLKSLPLVNELYSLFNIILKSLGFALMLTCVAFAVIFKPRVAQALLLVFGVIMTAIATGRSPGSDLWTLYAGIVLLVAAFWIQREDEPKSRFWNKVAERLRTSVPRARLDMKMHIAILRRLNENDSLAEREILGIVAGKLGCDSGDPRLRGICVRLLDQLVAQEGLAEARDGNRGRRLVLAIPDDPPDIFSGSARITRVAIVIVFCTLYILSPIDLIPDATPIFGVMDDMVIGVVGLLSCLRTAHGRGRLVDRRTFNL